MPLEDFYIYKGDIPFDQLEIPEPDPREAEDYDWVMTDPEVQRRFGGRVVAVYQKTVFGAGKTPEEALEDAAKKPNCPALDDLVVVDVLHFPKDAPS